MPKYLLYKYHFTKYISSDGSKPHDSLVRNGFSWVIFPSFLLYLEAEAERGILLIVHSPFNSLEKIIIEIIFSVRTSGIFSTRIFILVVPDTCLFSLDINAKNWCILLDIIKLVLLDKCPSLRLSSYLSIMYYQKDGSGSVFLEWREVRLSILSLFSSKYLRVSVWEAEENFWYSCL